MAYVGKVIDPSGLINEVYLNGADIDKTIEALRSLTYTKIVDGSEEYYAYIVLSIDDGGVSTPASLIVSYTEPQTTKLFFIDGEEVFVSTEHQEVEVGEVFSKETITLEKGLYVYDYDTDSLVLKTEPFLVADDMGVQGDGLHGEQNALLTNFASANEPFVWEDEPTPEEDDEPKTYVGRLKKFIANMMK